MLFVFSTLIWAGCASGNTTAAGTAEEAYRAEGVASYYSDKLHGNTTANGEVYDRFQLTGAHRELPFGTWLAVTNLDNGKTVEVRINDRGPFVEGRIVDVSRRAAEQLDFIEKGLTRVRVEEMARVR